MNVPESLFDETTLKIIRERARTLKKNPVFHGKGVEDIEQDLAVRVCELRDKFDPLRQTWHAFVRVVVASAGCNQIDAHSSVNEKTRRRQTVSLDCAVDQDEDGLPLTLADTTPDTVPSIADEVAFKIDLAERMALLPDELKPVLARMMQGESHASIAEDMGLSKMAFSRKYATPIQQILAPDKFEEYRDNSASA